MDIGIAQRGQQKSKTLWLLSKCIKFQNNNKFGTTQNTYLNILDKFPDNIYIFAIQNTCSLFNFTSVFKPRAIKGFFKTTQILKNPLHILLINVAFSQNNVIIWVLLHSILCPKKFMQHIFFLNYSRFISLKLCLFNTMKKPTSKYLL